MLEAGVDCARLNCSHSDPDELRRRAHQLRELSLENNHSVALMFDLQGPKLRLTENIDDKHLALGEEITLSGSSNSGPDDAVPVAVDDITELVTEKSEIAIGDGMPRLEVLSVEEEHVRARVTTAGSISPRKGIAVTFAGSVTSSLTDKDLVDLDVAAEVGADFIALSFVRQAEDIAVLRAMLAERGSKALLIAKIEKLEAVDNLEEISRVADGLMVARGDYGVEAGVAAVPLMQKRTIKVAGQAETLVITATQMLETMISSPVPTRAEASDVANAVLDGTSAAMLSAETAIGAYPVEAVDAMRTIIVEAESDDAVYTVSTGSNAGGAAGALMHSAVMLATEADAQAIIIPTESGASARTCSRYRPRQPILALTPYQRVVDQLALEWGVHGMKFEGAGDLEDLITLALEEGKHCLGLSPGAKVVISAGSWRQHGSTNLITMRTIA